MLPIVYLATVTMGLGCKVSPQPHSDSDLSTLDNFAVGQDLVINQCQGSFRAEAMDPAISLKIQQHELIQVADAQRAEFDRTMTAVPTNLKNLFFSAGYRINIQAGNQERCLQVHGKPNKACLVSESVRDPAGQAREGISLLVEADPQAIRHGLLRGIAYAITTRLSYLSIDDAGSLELGPQPDQAFADWKLRNAVAVIHDVATTRGISSSTFGENRSLLPADGALLARATTLQQRQIEWNRLVTQNPSGLTRFADYAFAEAMDSFWCNPNQTRTVMQQLFPTSFQLFRDELDIALQTAWNAPESADSAEHEAEGLALTQYRSYRFPVLGAPFRAAARVARGAAWVATAPVRARQNLVSRVGSYPRIRTGRLFPRLWGY
jgi:hypothetical protein